jgi:hypothetical protein
MTKKEKERRYDVACTQLSAFVKAWTPFFKEHKIKTVFDYEWPQKVQSIRMYAKVLDDTACLDIWVERYPVHQFRAEIEFEHGRILFLHTYDSIDELIVAARASYEDHMEKSNV